ncbi:type II toxin-antitoxin system VapC family toxin [Candidatus Micrarchaeota archaeon]|nr:type II toxin-antitoxin system VapC family toxin [Candidatus Micrarchaeota archaeon]
MSRYLLDTSAILHILRGTPEGLRIAQLIQDSDVLTSVVCYCESLNNSHLTWIERAELFLSKVTVLPVDLSEGQLAKKIQFECRKKGKMVPTLDSLVAATAMKNDAEVVAVDSDFERIDGLKKHLF